MAELTLEQKRAIAIATAKARAAKAKAGQGQTRAPERGPIDRFNRGLGGGVFADLLGIVPGAAMELGNLTGLTNFENTSGADLVRRKLEPLGLTGAPGEDLGTAGRVGQAIGQFGVPGVAGTAGLARRGAVGAVDASKNIGLLRGVNQGGQVARTGAARAPAATAGGRIIDDMAAGAAAAPTATGLSEVTAAAGEALGREAGEGAFGDGWESDVGGVIGGILGGLGPTGAAATGRRALDMASDNLPAVGAIRRAVERVFRLEPRGAVNRRVSQRLRSVAEQPADPQDTLPAQRNLRNTDDVDASLLTPAQQTDDPGIMSLDARRRAEDPKVLANWRVQVENNMANLRQQLLDTGADDELRRRVQDAASPEEAARIRQEYTQAIDDMALVAAANAERRLANMTPNQRRSSASKVLRSELEKAYRTGRAEEGALWDMVPEDVKHRPVGLVERYAQLRSTLTPENAGTMPSKAREFLSKNSPSSYYARGKDGKLKLDEDGNPIIRAIPVKRLQNLRSELLAEADEAATGPTPNRNRARLAHEMAEAVLDEINSIEAASEPLSVARTFSQHFNDRFTRGPVGEVLQKKGRGDVSVAPEVTLDRTIGRGGVEAERAARAFKQAFESPNEAVRGAFTDYLKDDFHRRAMRDGEFNPAGARAFMNRYKDLLDSQPALKAMFEQAIQDGNLTAVSRSVQDGAARVLGTNNPAREIRRIKQMASKDPTGAVWSSFRRGLTQELFERARVRNPRGDIDSEIISGSALLEMLNGEKMGPALKQAFSKTELTNLRRIANTAQRIERDIGARAAANLVTDEPSMLSMLISGYMGALGGARASRAAGGGAAGLRSAQLLSSALQKMQRMGIRDPAAKVISAALSDKRRMDDLLTIQTKPGYEERVIPRINAWLVGLIDEYEAEEDGVPPTLFQQSVPRYQQELGVVPGQ